MQISGRRHHPHDPLARNYAHIGHFHTGGVPGRHEIDDTQGAFKLRHNRHRRTLASPAFCRHNCSRDPLTSMKQAFDICNV
jgi:hydroxypyruvate isomerase